MTDVLTPEQRRLNMSRIRGRNTKPELLLRRGLHSRGLRFRLHRRDLPGRPDLVFPLHRAVIFVHGCFWHGHGCALCKEPATRTSFWASKIARNADRDQTASSEAMNLGWRVLTVWECAMRGPGRMHVNELLDRCEVFILNHNVPVQEIMASMPSSVVAGQGHPNK
jgi:DNA mismatch endonuclease (patch repair protein)